MKKLCALLAIALAGFCLFSFGCLEGGSTNQSNATNLTPSFGPTLPPILPSPSVSPSPIPTSSSDCDHCKTLADCCPGAARCVDGHCSGTDEHGCTPDGGYEWCEAKQKCIRSWEEACDEGNATSIGANLYECEKDLDCIPKPECHPMECINSKYKNSFKMPEMCTMIFMNNAAYSQKDCACVNKKCINKNNVQLSPTATPLPAKRYVLDDAIKCKTIALQCNEGESAFSDELGCGCVSGESGPEKYYCLNEDRKNKECYQYARPVCGWFESSQVQCFKYPCASNFGNDCKACQDQKVEYWTEGSCPK